jgi:hypothetical protein
MLDDAEIWAVAPGAMGAEAKIFAIERLGSLKIGDDLKDRHGAYHGSIASDGRNGMSPI